MLYIPKFDYEKPSLWSYRIKVILKSRELWHLVDGTEVAPPEGSAAFERLEMVSVSARLQFLVDIQAGKGSAGDLDRAARALPPGIPAREVAQHTRVHVGKAGQGWGH
jgi:hypothetical protein